MYRFAGVIPHNVSAPDAGHHHAVGSLHTMLESNIRLERIHNLLGSMRHELAIIRMHQGKQSAVRLVSRDRRHAQEVVNLG
jgi:hypothetical protein